jgi:hypothetical protein
MLDEPVNGLDPDGVCWIRLHELHGDDASLEEAFMELTGSSLEFAAPGRTGGEG